MQNLMIPLILASASSARGAVLRGLGVQFTAHASSVDEAPVKQAYDDPGKAAMALAVRKAQDIARTSPEGALVIGADQILVCDGQWFDKPRDIDEAADHLRRLRGRWHVLHTAVACVRDHAVVWRNLTHPALRVRDFSQTWLEAYLAAEGAALLQSVGAYRLEGMGAQLFAEIIGEHSAILGLPALPLLGFLRESGALLA